MAHSNSSNQGVTRADQHGLQVFFLSTLAVAAALGIWIRGLTGGQPIAGPAPKSAANVPKSKQATPAQQPAASSAKPAPGLATIKAAAKSDWQPLFDGKSLDGWKVLVVNCFDAHGKVHVADKSIMLETGEPATGIAYQKELPKIDYELELEARRVDGNDFFCGLTFPVADSFCTLIVGGWGGSVIGLSNVDHMHAGENETTTHGDFKQDQWYTIRLRVAKDKIEAWLDKERLIELKTAGRKLSIWWEQEPARPLGIATWHTKAALRNIRLRRLSGE